MKLIDKSAVVAEIRKRLLPVIRDKHYDEYEEGQDSERIAILDIINAIEVKDVDLEKEIAHYIDEHKIELQGYFDIRRIARHFFVLGLNARK